MKDCPASSNFLKLLLLEIKFYSSNQLTLYMIMIRPKKKKHARFLDRLMNVNVCPIHGEINIL